MTKWQCCGDTLLMTRHDLTATCCQSWRCRCTVQWPLSRCRWNGDFVTLPVTPWRGAGEMMAWCRWHDGKVPVAQWHGAGGTMARRRWHDGAVPATQWRSSGDTMARCQWQNGAVPMTRWRGAGYTMAWCRRPGDECAPDAELFWVIFRRCFLRASRNSVQKRETRGKQQNVSLVNPSVLWRKGQTPWAELYQ